MLFLNCITFFLVPAYNTVRMKSHNPENITRCAKESHFISPSIPFLVMIVYVSDGGGYKSP
jgi:hypothetical protein